MGGGWLAVSVESRLDLQQLVRFLGGVWDDYTLVGMGNSRVESVVRVRFSMVSK